MARGDAVVEIYNVSAGATQDVTVASGEEWVITSFADANQGATSRIQYTDGTLTTHVAGGDDSQATGGAVRLVVNNGHYFSLRNAAGGSAYPLAYGGYKTKDE